MIDRLSNVNPKSEQAQGLIELIVALTVLSIGIGSLLTLLTSSALSLQRSDQKGTALVLAEKQIELYRGVIFKDIRLDQNSLNNLASPSVDPLGLYTSANGSDPNIPVASGQLTDTAPGSVTTDCPDGAVPVECAPVQPRVVGPDHRRYRIDTYIHQDTPNGGDTVDTVFVDVRDATNPSKILARSSSTFSGINIGNLTGKAIVKMSFSAPKADITGAAINPSQISATLSNGNGETGVLSFFVLPAPLTPSVPCTGASWSPSWVVNVSGDGTYHPTGSYTPPIAGTYYWYASYSGDSANKKASAICGASMARMTVQASKWSPALSVSTSASTGVVNTAIPASAITGSVSSSSGTTTAAITFMVYGPSASAPGACTTTPGGLWAQVGTITPNGNGSYSPNVGFTPGSVGTYWYYANYPGDTTNNAASSTCSAAMAKTVVSTPPDTFGISAIGASQNAGSAITVATITAQLYGGGTDTTYTGVKTLTFTGPGTSPKGNAPTYPATVTFTNGVATNVSFTTYNVETTTLTATQGLITGTSNSFTVNGGVTAGFTIDPVGTQTVNTAFGVTVRTVDAYGNPSTYTAGPPPHAIVWTGPANAPNGQAPLYPGTATSLTFNNVGGQGVAVATGIKLYKAASTTLTATEGAKTGTSASFTVNAASPTSIAFINCTLPSAANTTCAGSPLSTGNNGTLQANIALKDAYGNIATAASAVSINLTSSSTTDYTVAPTPVTIGVGGSQSNQLTVTPAQNNPATTTITAHATSGGFADVTIQVQK
jgi:type II secretory pathway pseudopilin PulG